MVSTRTRSAAAEARKKPALHDITNDGKGGAKRKAEGRAQPEGGLFDGRPRGREKSDVLPSCDAEIQMCYFCQNLIASKLVCF